MPSRAELANCGDAEEVVRMIGGKWKLLILRQLVYGGVKRFNALRRDTPGITQTMLTKQLRALEADGLITRTIYPEVPPRVEYAATAKAQDLDAFFRAMYDWGRRNVE
ncbi:MAG: helix-turn-helix domain-containing protein, partial [Cyanobacteria bacterium P01_D01_bin.44]